MTIEEPDQNQISDHILDWLGDAVSFLPPPFLDDPYGSGDIDDINCCQWWDPVQDLDQDFLNTSTNSLSSTTATTATSTTLATSTTPAIPNHPPPSDLIKKRKVSDDPVPKTSQNRFRNNHSRQINEAEDGDPGVEVVATKKTGGNKRTGGKAGANNCNNGNNKEGRWAEQLLNPCAGAITAGNLTRVQHLLYVLHELASATGDANHRLASHGLRALTHHLSSSTSSSVSPPPINFATTEPRYFQKSLLKFSEVSPWFTFPNNIANTSILQLLSEEQDPSQNLHILDIGVSHGLQWPTLLEALSRRSGGPPPLVRLTIIAATIESNQNRETPFSIGPPGDNYSSRLLCFAKSLNINLQINRIDNHPLHFLNSQIIDSTPDETLIVCAQFRLHHLNHNNPDLRTEFLNALRNLHPKGVILSENDMECSCTSCGDFATAFSRRVEYLWRFLDSTSSAFKGRESDERKVMEGEAVKALTNQGEMNEGKEKWCGRMREARFVGEVFGEDAIDGGRALLRKYDSNWEMRVEDRDGCVGLWWKGEPVSFCSLWKSDKKVLDS